MAVHAVRLDERHRGGDGSEQELVCLGRWGGSGRRTAVRLRLERLEQLAQRGMRCDELAPAALEQLAPLFRDGRRVVEVLLEQSLLVTRVQPVDVRHRSRSFVSAPASLPCRTGA